MQDRQFFCAGFLDEEKKPWGEETIKGIRSAGFPKRPGTLDHKILSQSVLLQLCSSTRPLFRHPAQKYSRSCTLEPSHSQQTHPILSPTTFQTDTTSPYTSFFASHKWSRKGLVAQTLGSDSLRLGWLSA